MKKTLFRMDIQGLRGISVLAVVLFHAWSRIVPGGFVGVDIFFVISGFVITNTILRDYAMGEFSIANFYRRRVRRIFPALYVLIAFTLIASWWLLSPDNYYELGKTALATVLFSSNIEFLRLSGYFDGQAILKPLLHTWSLSVEEQFYVLFPIFVVFVHRYAPRYLRLVLLILALISLGLSVWMLPSYPTATFYLTPPRAFELLMGAIVACPGWSETSSLRVRNVMSIVGLIMIAGALMGYSQATPFPGPTALLPCLGAALLIRAGIGNGASSVGGKILSVKPLTFFGDVSYSLYLWHWPALVLARHFVGGELSTSWIVGCLSFAFVASLVSLHFIERPFLQKTREKLPYLQIGSALMVGASVACLAIVLLHGVPKRFSPASLAIFAAADDFNHRRAECHSWDTEAIPYDKDCTFGTPGVSPDVAVWGDSHGAELVAAIGERLSKQHRSAMEITASACPPAIQFSPKGRPFCAGHNDDTLHRIDSDPRIRTVVLAANFAEYQKSPDYGTFLDGFQRVVEALHSDGKLVVLVYPVPVYNFDPPAVLGMRNQHGMALAGVGVDRPTFEQSNHRALNMLDSLVNAGLADRVIPEDALCYPDKCKVYDPEIGVLYFNNAHLSIKGARIVAERIPL